LKPNVTWYECSLNGFLQKLVLLFQKRAFPYYIWILIMSPLRTKGDIVLVWFFFCFCFFSAKLVWTITCYNYLTSRSKVKVPRRSLQYVTHRLMVMHPHMKYHWPISKENNVMARTRKYYLKNN
jgi:hypothetical protein